uniref:EF-hand domain-containing protein n=1 Tax=Panagrolaimus superbus TaxID=310955 RepID=A0A914YGQ1_9BILA
MIFWFTIFVGFATVAFGQRVTQAPRNIREDITPIPMDSLNPRLTEFRRIDSNSDNSLTFTEFLLGDRPYLEAQSRNFHNLDTNSDGRVSREEFENFYRDQDETHRRLRNDGFFKQLGNVFDNSQNPPILFNFPAHLFGGSINASKNGSTFN